MGFRLFTLAAMLVAGPAYASPSYRMVEAMPGPDGGWDYASVDPGARRAYVARTDSVTVFDLSKAGAARAIGAIQRGHAAMPLPGGDIVLVTSGNDNSVRLLNARTGTETARLAVGQKPDAAVYDRESGHAFVVNAKSGTISEIDPRKAVVVRTLQSKPGLEEAAIGRDRTLFVNNEEAGEIETLDLKRGASGPPIAMTGCEGPTGLAYDIRTDQLVSACANGKAAIVDAHTHKLKKLIDIGRGPDGAIIDTARRVVLIPCGLDGVIEILALDGPGGVRKIASVKTEVGARTGALDPSTGRVYLPTARFAPAATPGARPIPLPGSFHVLVLSPS